jgi:predicted ester cyclase
MTIEQNKALRQQWTKLIAERKLDEAFAQIGPGFVSHTARGKLGVEGVRAYFEMVFTALPDQQVTSIQMIAEGDKVVDHMRVEATHTGHFMGIPPSGKRVSWTFIDIVRYVDGKMVEHWNESDQLDIMQQMGVMPAQPQR